MTTAKMLGPSPAEMYRASVDRDPSYDGLFVMAVKTTGIFCRATCPARKPRFENVEFFETTTEAIRRGYRACKRCRPTEAASPEWFRALMDRLSADPGARITDENLRGLGIGPDRARRYFKEHLGMTFHAYHRARRMGSALVGVRSGEDLLEVGLGHGFESASGFREAFSRLFGAPPGRSRDASCLVADWLDTPLGPMVAVAGDAGLCLLEFADRKSIEAQVAALRGHFEGPIVPGRNVHLDRVAAELSAYFAGALREFTVPLIHPGSPFQEAVWGELKRIPYGRTTSYGAVAEAIGRPGASQAVGRANGENRLAIVVPCHRVVRSDGHLCGYAGGLRRKEWLLDLERRTLGGEVQKTWRFVEDSPMIG